MKTLPERLRERAGQYDESDWHSAIELEAADALERRLRHPEGRLGCNPKKLVATV